MTRIGDMEHATCVSHDDGCVESGHAWDYLLFHEMSHQWWGDWVTCGEWKDLWLNEGFGTYCEALGMEILHGFDSYMSYVTLNIFPRARAANDSYSIYDPDYYWGASVYQKGAAVMHMLRMLLGDSTFFQAWREFGQEHAFGNVVTAQWQAKLEEHYGDSLDWFFQPWVYGTRYPRYQVTYSVGCFNTLTIEQIQPTETLFRMPLDVWVVTSTDTFTFTVWNEAVRWQIFVDSLCTEVPQWIVIDPYSKILKSATYQIVVDAAPPPASLPTEFAITSVYPNPANAVATIAFDLPGAGPVRLRIFDLLGREVSRQDLGFHPAGSHRVTWDGSAFASGLYLVNVESGADSRVTKVALIK
jgi:hypothetical protein